MFLIIGCEVANNHFYDIAENENFVTIQGDTADLNDWAINNQDKHIVNFYYFTLSTYLIQFEPKSNNNFEIQKQRKFKSYNFTNEDIKNTPIANIIQKLIKDNPKINFINFQGLSHNYMIYLYEEK